MFVKENRVGRKKTDTDGTSDRLCAVSPEELMQAVDAVQSVDAESEAAAAKSR